MWVLRTAGARLDGASVYASRGLRESAEQVNQTTGLSAGPNDLFTQRDMARSGSASNVGCGCLSYLSANVEAGGG